MNRNRNKTRFPSSQQPHAFNFFHSLFSGEKGERFSDNLVRNFSGSRTFTASPLFHILARRQWRISDGIKVSEPGNGKGKHKTFTPLTRNLYAFVFAQLIRINLIYLGIMFKSFLKEFSSSKVFTYNVR